MSQSPKKQSFLHGAALLAIATMVVKVIGAIYKLPLKYILNDDGFAYFSSAYEIYNLLLLISTAGLPVAMSRMISEATSLSDKAQMKKVYNTSRAIFLALGAVSTALMMVFCRELAASQEMPEASLAIFCLAPCAFLMGIISTYRGFFQGQGNMIPTSVSQVIEAVFKLGFGLLGAWLIVALGGSIPMAAAGAILGVTVSCLVSVVYLFSVFHKQADPEVLQLRQPGFHGITAKQLLSIAVPITIGAAGLQLLTVIEISVYMDRLVDLLSSGQLNTPLVQEIRDNILANSKEVLTDAELYSKIAANMKGVYNFSQSIYNLPNSFITPITVSVIPAITAQLTLNNPAGAKETAESSARITSLIALPCAVGLILLAEPIMALLGSYTGGKLTLAAQLMAILGVSTFLRGAVLTTNAIMQAYNHPNIPVINMLSCGVLRLLVVYILVGNPAIGILGVPIGTALSNLCIAVLNIFCIRRCLNEKPRIATSLLRSLLPAAIMGVVAFGTWFGLKYLGISSRLILCGGPVALAGVTYLVCAVVFKSITREDCLLLPKGDKIAKLLRL
jgi:stage V sporulation protein B